MNYGTTIREPVSGNVFATIPFEEWLYFEYEQVVNDVSRAQGILSPFKTPKFINTFQMQDGETLDNIMEVWYKPEALRGADNSNLRFFLDWQFFLRYQRLEHLNDGRPRDTFIGRSKYHLLKRCRILPPQESSVDPPYQPQSPYRTPPYETISQTSPTPFPLGAGAWVLPTTETYDGSFPVPSTQFQGTSTAHRMCQLVEYCKTYINPEALSDVTIANPPTNGGLADHPIDARYDNLLEFLKSMSASTWYAWYHGKIQAGRLPVDFDLVPDPNKKNGWIFTVKAGGFGEDRTIDAVMGGTSGSKVYLSTSNDNIIQPVSVRDRTNEKTRVWVGGKNNGTGRDVLGIFDLDRASLSPWNTIDHFIHSAKIRPFNFLGNAADGIIEALERGQSRARDESPRSEYSFILRFNRSLRKGINLNVGDLISADLFSKGIANYQVIKMKHTFSKTGGVTIRGELGELDGRRFKGGSEFQQVINLIVENQNSTEYNGEVD